MKVETYIENYERVVIEERKMVSIEMSMEDALLLEAITWAIDGRLSGPRGRIDVLRRTLRNAGICSNQTYRDSVMDTSQTLILNEP